MAEVKGTDKWGKRAANARGHQLVAGFFILQIRFREFSPSPEYPRPHDFFRPSDASFVPSAVARSVLSGHPLTEDDGSRGPLQVNHHIQTVDVGEDFIHILPISVFPGNPNRLHCWIGPLDQFACGFEAYPIDFCWAVHFKYEVQTHRGEYYVPDASRPVNQDVDAVAGG